MSLNQFKNYSIPEILTDQRYYDFDSEVTDLDISGNENCIEKTQVVKMTRSNQSKFIKESKSKVYGYSYESSQDNDKENSLLSISISLDQLNVPENNGINTNCREDVISDAFNQANSNILRTISECISSDEISLKEDSSNILPHLKPDKEESIQSPALKTKNKKKTLTWIKNKYNSVKHKHNYENLVENKRA